MIPRPLPVTSHVHLPVRVAPPHNSSDAGAITTRLHHVLERDASGIRLVYANWSNDQGADLPGPDAIRVSATVALDGGAPLPVTFDGDAAALLLPGDARLSDPLPIAVRRGATLTSTTTARGRTVPLGPCTDATEGEGVAVGEREPEPGTAYGYGPWQVLGDVADVAPLLLVTGDSNAVGFGDRRGTADHLGWVRRAFAGTVPLINLAVSGGTALGAQTDASKLRRGRLLQWAEPDVALAALGTNDLQRGGPTLAEMQRRLTAHWLDLAGAGRPVHACTIPPVTTSTDGWLTIPGQVPTPGSDVRAAVNAWLRTVPAPLAGVVDVARALCAPESEHVWGAGLTDDGVHPNAVGHAAAAGAAAWLVASLCDAEDGAAPLLQRHPDASLGQLR